MSQGNAQSGSTSQDSARQGSSGRGFAFVFPGQGSQAVGMGADVAAASPAARAIFDAANAALGFDLARLCFEGPEDELRETINAQPAIVTVSLALLAALRAALGAAPPDLTGAPIFPGPPTPDYVAGHSVGEYAALAAAGALDLGATLRLVRERGRLMHHEGTVCPGGMAAIIGMDDAALVAVCEEATTRARTDLGRAADAPATHPGAGRVIVANYNSPGQTVLSGERRALDLAMGLARERGARRVVPLAVSGAFHSPVMAPAANGLGTAVAAAGLRDAAVPVVANISGRAVADAAALREELAGQIAAPVQWTRTVEYLAEHGVHTFVEIGPGQVLSGLIKRGAKGATTLAVGTAAEVPAVADRLRAAMTG
ncbi:MAG TPA: ACP S-malonyltransferase [Ktedonobacterales bacterium]